MKSSETFLPNFCSLETTLVLTMTSLVLGLGLTLADFSASREFLADFGVRAFFIIWIVLLSGGLLCLLRTRLAGLAPLSAAILTFAVVQVATLAVTVAALWGLNRLDFPLGQRPAPAETVGRILAVSSLATAVWLRYQFVHARWRQQGRAEALARLNALQSRMRPHFLFNGLNSIAGVMRDDPAAAEELLLDMAEVFRAILKRDTHLVPLNEEIELTRHYLRIEQLRLGSRLEVVWDLGQAPGDALLPPLSLQPLVENAIRHGIERADHGGRVEIGAGLARRQLVLTISNTVPESRPDERDRPGSGQALANLRARLEVCFPEQSRLSSTVAEGRYHVRMELPYLPSSDPAGRRG